MPLTQLQRQVFEVIRSNRSPNSYLYGALAIHKDEDSPRYSRDIDIVKSSAKWREAITEAKQLVLSLPADNIGCAFLDKTGAPTTANPDSSAQTTHLGSVGGAWPRLAN